MEILRFDLKIFVNKIKKSIQGNMPNENIDLVTDIILEIPYVIPSILRAHMFWPAKNLHGERIAQLFLNKRLLY